MTIEEARNRVKVAGYTDITTEEQPRGIVLTRENGTQLHIRIGDDVTFEEAMGRVVTKAEDLALQWRMVACQIGG